MEAPKIIIKKKKKKKSALPTKINPTASAVLAGRTDTLQRARAATCPPGMSRSPAHSPARPLGHGPGPGGGSCHGRRNGQGRREGALPRGRWHGPAGGSGWVPQRSSWARRVPAFTPRVPAGCPDNSGTAHLPWLPLSSAGGRGFGARKQRGGREPSAGAAAERPLRAGARGPPWGPAPAPRGPWEQGLAPLRGEGAGRMVAGCPVCRAAGCPAAGGGRAGAGGTSVPPQNPSQPAAPRAPRGAGTALQQDTAPSSSGAAATCWDVAGGAPQPAVPLLWAQHGTREGRTHTHTHLLESCCRGSTCWMCSRAGHAASPGTARHRAEPQTPPAVSAPGQALAQALQVVFHWSLSPTRLGAVSSRGIPVALTCAGAGAAAPLSGSRRSRRNPSRQRTRARGNPGRAAPEKCWHLPRPQQCRRRGLTFTRPGPWCRGAPHTAGPAAHRMGRQHWAGLCPSSPSPQSQQCPVPPRHPSRSGAQGLRAGSEGSSRAGRGPG